MNFENENTSISIDISPVSTYELLEGRALLLGTVFFNVGSNAILTKKEIRNVCKYALVKAIAIYFPELEENFTQFLDQVVKYELKTAAAMKEKGLPYDSNEKLRYIRPGSTEEDLCKEYLKTGATPRFKARAMKLLKSRQ